MAKKKRSWVGASAMAKKPRRASLDGTAEGGCPHMSISLTTTSRGLVFSAPEILDEVFGGSQSKRENADGGGLVGAVQKDAGIAHVEVGDIVGLAKAICNKMLWIVPHAAGAGFVQAESWHLGFVAGVFEHAAGRAQNVGAHLFRMFPHLEYILVPLEMQPRYRNAVGIFHSGIEIHVVRIRAQRGSLDSEAHRRGIAPLDLALVRRAEPFEFIGESGIISATTVRVDGISADKLFFMRIFQILPARHPGDGAVADVVGEWRPPHQLRKISPRGTAVTMVAEVAAQLSAGIRDAVGPVPRLGIQHDAGALDTRRGDHYRVPVHFDFLFRLAVDVGDSAGVTVFVGKNILGQRIGAQFQVVGGLGFGQQEPWSGKERADVAAGGALAAEMAGGMALMRLRELGAAIRQVRNTNLVATRFQNTVQTAELEGRQI